MSNTRDTLGEQATLDGLVNRTLKSLEEDGVTTLKDYALVNNTGIETADMENVSTIGNYAFAGCENLKTLNTPNLTTLNQYGLQNCISLNEIDTGKITTIANNAIDDSGIGKLVLPLCTSLGTYTGKGMRLSTVDITNQMSIDANKFNSANSLVHLILRANSLCSLANANALTGTGIASGVGWVYVPTSLVDTYKAASNWSTLAAQIVDLSEYPKTLQDETISDSWATILANESNNTYKAAYSLGDIKYVDVGGTQVPMVIVKFDEGNSKITWLSKGFIARYKMNDTSTTVGGWASCKVRNFLRNVIYPQIETTVRNAIVPVEKTYYLYEGSSHTQTITDTVWIPSAREMFGGTSYESSGDVYTGFFTSDNARIKTPGISGAANYYWLRSVSSASYFRCVDHYGYVNNYSANNANGVALGFCL